MDEATRRKFPFVDVLEQHAARFRQDALAAPLDHFVPMPSRENYDGNWRCYPLYLGAWGHEYPGVDLEANRRRFPETVRILDGIEGLFLAGFMRLEPRSEIKTHTDFRGDDEVRCHVALQVPEHEASSWPVGRARLMDVRVPHAARNPDVLPRLTLLVDVRMPFVIPVGSIPLDR